MLKPKAPNSFVNRNSREKWHVTMGPANKQPIKFYERYFHQYPDISSGIRADNKKSNAFFRPI